MMPNTSLRIDEIQCRPSLVPESAPYDVVIIDRDRVINVHVFDRSAHIVQILLKSELRRVDSDHHQSLILVFLRPRAHVRKRAQPVDAGVSPEIDEDDFSTE